MAQKQQNIHPDVFKLGLVSFLTDVSSEAIFSIFAVFFTVIIGASTALLGIVEGLADFSSSSLDYLAGWLSDKLGKRKPFALIGYGFSTLAKISLLIANTIASLAFFRVVERLGKSFRGPPRDAWLANVAEKSIRGYSFGVHKALDKAGAVLGPLLAYWLLRAWGQNLSTFRVLFLGAVVAAALAVLVLAFMKDRPEPPHPRENMFRVWRELSPNFKIYLWPAAVFSLAYFSFGFLLLRAYDFGFAIQDVVLLYALFNIAFVIAAVPIGKLGDWIGRKYIIGLGYLTYALMALGFVLANQKWEIILLFVIFGVFYSIDEAQSKAFISDLEKERRASAIGFYNFTTGLVYIPASVVAGWLWTFQPTYAFNFAALIAALALGVFIFSLPRIMEGNEPKRTSD